MFFFLFWGYKLEEFFDFLEHLLEMIRHLLQAVQMHGVPAMQYTDVFHWIKQILNTIMQNTVHKESESQ